MIKARFLVLSLLLISNFTQLEAGKIVNFFNNNKLMIVALGLGGVGFTKQNSKLIQAALCLCGIAELRTYFQQPNTIDQVQDKITFLKQSVHSMQNNLREQLQTSLPDTQMVEYSHQVKYSLFIPNKFFKIFVTAVGIVGIIYAIRWYKRIMQRMIQLEQEKRQWQLQATPFVQQISQIGQQLAQSKEQVAQQQQQIVELRQQIARIKKDSSEQRIKDIVRIQVDQSQALNLIEKKITDINAFLDAFEKFLTGQKASAANGFLARINIFASHNNQVAVIENLLRQITDAKNNVKFIKTSIVDVIDKTFGCSICMEDIATLPTDYITPCGHIFHKACLAQCAGSSRRQFPCPLCRTLLDLNN